MIAALKLIAPLLLYLGGVIILMMALSGRVKFGLYFLVPLLPLQNVMEKFQAFPMGKDLNDILLLAMLAGWIFSSLSENRPVFMKSSLNGVLILLFFYTYFSLWLGTFTLNLPPPIDIYDLSVQRWKNYMIFPLLYFLVSNNIRNLPDMKKLFIAMCAAMFLMNYYNVQQVSDLTAWYSRSKLTGTFVNLGANETAAFYAIYPFVLMGIFLFVKSWKWRLPIALLIIGGVYINIFCYSRGAYMATLGATVIFSLLKQKKLLIPIVLILALWQTALPQSVIDRLTFTEQEGEIDASAARRLELWDQAVLYFHENPVFGIGFDAFRQMGHGDTHSIYMKTLAEQGITGILILLAIWGVAIAKSWHLYQKADDVFLKGLGFGFFVCIFAVIICNFFGDRWTHLPLGAFFWVYLGMVERGLVLSVKPAQEAENKIENKNNSRKREYVDPRLANPYLKDFKKRKQEKG